MSITLSKNKLIAFLTAIITSLTVMISNQQAYAAISNCDAFSDSLICLGATKKTKRLNQGFRPRGLSRHKRKIPTRKKRRRYKSHAKTHCFPQKLRTLISKVESHYGKKLKIISGYRSPRHNRRVGGAKRSQHMHCKAVDFSVRGINKYRLARFVKTLPGVGGVGTYCKSGYIHMDVGPKRSWNRGCSKKRKSKMRFVKNNKRRIRKSRRSYRVSSYKKRRKARKSRKRHIALQGADFSYSSINR